MSRTVDMPLDERWQLEAYRHGPSTETYAGLLWRMFWIMPPMQVARLCAIAAVTLAIVAWSWTVDPRRFAFPWGLSLLHIFPFMALFYLQFIESFQPSSFTVSGGRALAVLPRRREEMRGGAWFVDVCVSPLLTVMVAMTVALVVPSSLAFKVWFGIVVLLGSLILAGLRAAMVIGQLSYARNANPTVFLAGLRHVDGYVVLGTIVSFLCIVFARSSSWPLPLAAAVGVFAIAWSWFRMPFLASGKGGGWEASGGEGGRTSSHMTEVLRVFLAGPLTVGAFVLAFLLVPRFMQFDVSDGMAFMLLFGSFGMANLLSIRTRAVRHLPLSTRQLTGAIGLFGLLTTVPLVALFVLQFGSRLSYPWLVLLALAVLLNGTALTASGIWMMSYVLPYMLFFFGLVFTLMIAFYSVMRGSIEGLIIFANCVGCVLLGLVLYSIRGHYFWRSKVYRPMYQNPQQNQTAVNNEGGEKFLLWVYVLFGVGGLVASVLVLVD